MPASLLVVVPTLNSHALLPHGSAPCRCHLRRARLGVDERHEGHGFGAALLLDVITRIATLSDAIGCRGLLVHAESDQARGFYEHLIPEFERSPTDPLHLLLLLKDIRRTLRR